MNIVSIEIASQDLYRALAQRARLLVWDKPASACLSSCIECGRPVTRDALAAIEAGEGALRGAAQARKAESVPPEYATAPSGAIRERKLFSLRSSSH